jgi:hypothetical protein
MSFFGGSSSPPPPQPASTQTVSQTSEFPEEIKPFITDVLGKAKAQQEGRQFQKFQGPRLAEFTPEQEQAFAGISGIAEAGLGAYPGLASSALYAQQAQDAAQQGLKQFDITEAERLMNPFQQGVTDIEKREAIRQFEGVTQPQIGAQAVGEGGFGGSRHAILEAEAQRNLQQQLGDIQARGLRDAYTTAANQFEAERARQAAGAGQFAGFAQQFPGQAFRELGAVQSIGESKQSRDQRALDIALTDFLTEQEFPTRQLQEYQSLIRGFPMTPNQFTQRVTSVPPVPLSQQLLGLGATAAGIAGGFGAFGSGGGQIGSLPTGMKSGGQIQGGLSSLERHQDIEKGFFDFLIPGSVDIIDLIETGKIDPDDVGSQTELTVTVPSREGKKDTEAAVPEVSPLIDSKNPLRTLIVNEEDSDQVSGGGYGTIVAEMDRIRREGEDARKAYLTKSPEEIAFTELLKTHAGDLEEQEERDTELARRGYWDALAKWGTQVGSTYDPARGTGLIGQALGSAKDVETIKDLQETRLGVRDLEKEYQEKELQYNKLLADIPKMDREQAFKAHQFLAALDGDMLSILGKIEEARLEGMEMDYWGTLKGVDDMVNMLQNHGELDRVLPPEYLMNPKNMNEMTLIYNEAMEEALAEARSEKARGVPGAEALERVNSKIYSKMVQKIKDQAKKFRQHHDESVTENWDPEAKEELEGRHVDDVVKKAKNRPDLVGPSEDPSEQ